MIRWNPDGQGSSPVPDPDDALRAAIEHDRDLAWELYDVRPEHPRIAELAQSVLEREPGFTGMIILLALHREARGEIEEARSLLQGLVARRDRQYVNAVKKLRDLEFSDRRFTEALRLAELALREDPEPGWLDAMELGSALVFTGDAVGGWNRIDEAVEMAGRVDPERYADALGQRATRLLGSGAHPKRFLPAAQEALAADPGEPLLAATLAYAYLYEYRPAEAEQLLLGVLRADPTDEIAQVGLSVARAFLDPIARGDATLEALQASGMGEIAWRILRDQMFGTGVAEALEALDGVMPTALAESMRPPLGHDAAREGGGEAAILAWHDGQSVGSGDRWAIGRGFRLMSSDEIAEMEERIEAVPEDWPQWNAEEEYFTLILTDDAGGYLIEGPGGRLLHRRADAPDREEAPSLADWLWDRVAAFGGEDPRPIGHSASGAVG